jgi:dipeptidyl aminopeptidase/acylaminoacyl peptidase
MILVLVSLLGLAAVPLSAAAENAGPFTLEQVLGSPFPSSLVAARGSGKVAWVFNAKGVRNVWVAEAPDYKGRPVTAFTEDDGEEIGELAFTADASALVFVRGGAPNRASEIPNPLSRPEPRERALYQVSLAPAASRAPRRLASGDSPLPHPAEERVVFIDKKQVFVLDLKEGATPERLLAPRGGVGSLRFSPDGRKLAFVSDRGDHAYVGVYDFASKSIRWMDPGVDRDGEPAFSPDGGRVAFLRIPAGKPVLFAPAREGEPWSIRVADVATGTSREVFRADKGPGSVFREVVADNQVAWMGDRIVFAWEKTGWLHLYSIPVAGGTPTALTQGAFEVEYVTAGPYGTTVVYNSNEGDVDRRHIWAVPVAGGTPVRLTTSPGIQWAPVMTSDGALACLRSSASGPGRPTLKTGDDAGSRDLAPGSIPSDFPEKALVEPEAVTVTASDGMPVHAQSSSPAASSPGSGGRASPTSTAVRAARCCWASTTWTTTTSATR